MLDDAHDAVEGPQGALDGGECARYAFHPVVVSLRKVATKVDRILDVSLVTLKHMQTGDLLAEIELWEREPKLQRCMLNEHHQAGDVFNLVHVCTYIVVVGFVARDDRTEVRGTGRALPHGLLLHPVHPRTGCSLQPTREIDGVVGRGAR
jgi:hypothetical protein